MPGVVNRNWGAAVGHRARDHLRVVSPDKPKRYVETAKQMKTASDDRIEHRLYVGRRAADDLEHLGGSCLLLQRLFGLIEQPHVLDSDDGLVGESLEQRDLLVGKRPCGCPANGDDADCGVISH